MADDGATCTYVRHSGVPSLSDDDIGAYQPYVGGGWVHMKSQVNLVPGQSIIATLTFQCPLAGSNVQVTLPLVVFVAPGQGNAANLIIGNIPVSPR